MIKNIILYLIVFLPFSLIAENQLRDSVLFLGSDSLVNEFNEKVITIYYEPEVRIVINLPAELNKSKSTNLIFYALPNGNSIEWTEGKQLKEGDDWHYNIQHIGAQTRRLREEINDENIILVYLESSIKSWPAWRRKYNNSNELIIKIVDSVKSFFSSYNPKITLSAHSGGGSFLFGYINAQESIPIDVKRIIFLDANYGFDDSLNHSKKIADWLNKDLANCLCVFAYDDRNIMLDGKPVIGPTGGTYRRSFEMMDKLGNYISFDTNEDSIFIISKSIDNRAYFFIHKNPANEILHTVLVERNGFISGNVMNTKYENIFEKFWGEINYRKWIRRD